MGEVVTPVEVDVLVADGCEPGELLIVDTLSLAGEVGYFGVGVEDPASKPSPPNSTAVAATVSDRPISRKRSILPDPGRCWVLDNVLGGV